MVSASHLRTLMNGWWSMKVSAQHHQRSEGANIFSFRAARDAEVISSARRELAGMYLRRLEIHGELHD